MIPTFPGRLGAFLAGVSLALAAGCATPGPVAAPERPRLVVVVIVDGLLQRQVTDYRDQLSPDGFNRFLERGAWFADAHYGYANTLTGPGHATILTGPYPHASGIIGNDWRDPAIGKRRPHLDRRFPSGQSREFRFPQWFAGPIEPSVEQLR